MRIRTTTALTLLIGSFFALIGCRTRSVSPAPQISSISTTNEPNSISFTNKLRSTVSTNQLGSDAKLASSNVPGQQYPKIDSERRAEFRLRAPDALKAQVDIGGH